MSGDRSDENGRPARRARLETTHADAATAATLAAALAPDNTASITTAAEGRTVWTTVERSTTGGLAASVDDYVVNLAVADRVAAAGSGAAAGDGPATDRPTPPDVDGTDRPTTADRQAADDGQADTDRQADTDDTGDLQ